MIHFLIANHAETLTNKTISGASKYNIWFDHGTRKCTKSIIFYVWYPLQGNNTGDNLATKTVPSGDVIGTTDTQTMSNKSFSNNINMTNNRIINLATHPVANTDQQQKQC